ncbi:unnamed protein product [Psylliodes chrysocephalus]|uniref:Cellulase n=1 Tax=Psylliodes chrysocephalus TaxID=3402493 RepID=A0A9P0DAT2_9CUCU|nr:unnamed protein product [Psylliodes chrysocephala]
MKYALALLALVAAVLSEDIHFETVVGGRSGNGKTTRYWDCCKPSCAWKENIRTRDMKPVNTCAKNGRNTLSPSVQSGCNGGSAYMCNNNQPWAVNNTLGYGFAAASFAGGVDTNMCCACFKVDFTDQIAGKSMVIQVTNTGSDLSSNHFDIALPGGGVGIFNAGCHNQWNAPWNGWGDQYGGVKSRNECYTLPKDLQSGCLFRFDFLKNANNPGMRFNQVKCPREIIAKSGCSLDP